MAKEACILYRRHIWEDWRRYLQRTKQSSEMLRCLLRLPVGRKKKTVMPWPRGSKSNIHLIRIWEGVFRSPSGLVEVIREKEIGVIVRVICYQRRFLAQIVLVISKAWIGEMVRRDRGMNDHGWDGLSVSSSG